ncbi:MAG: hypothetical protein HWE34_00200 [Methylocystaceae bacterium]|nr:hypothetical protein [Methylocystaceae bacterium]
MDMNERVNDLIYVCKRMCEILTIENTALEDKNAYAMKATLEEKDKLSRFYERHTRAIAKDREGYKSVNEDLRDELKELSQELDELVQKNSALLKMQMQISQRIITKFAEVAKKITPHSGAYSDDANIGPRGETATPLSLNETL